MVAVAWCYFGQAWCHFVIVLCLISDGNICRSIKIIVDPTIYESQVSAPLLLLLQGGGICVFRWQHSIMIVLSYHIIFWCAANVCWVYACARVFCLYFCAGTARCVPAAKQNCTVVENISCICRLLVRVNI